METKVSKAQQEVWEWKEKLSSELGKLSPEERIKYVLTKTESTVQELQSRYIANSRTTKSKSNQ